MGAGLGRRPFFIPSRYRHHPGRSVCLLKAEVLATFEPAGSALPHEHHLPV